MRMKDDEWNDNIETFNLSSSFRLAARKCAKRNLCALAAFITAGICMATYGNGGQANYAAAKAA